MAARVVVIITGRNAHESGLVLESPHSRDLGMPWVGAVDTCKPVVRGNIAS